MLARARAVRRATFTGVSAVYLLAVAYKLGQEETPRRQDPPAQYGVLLLLLLLLCLPPPLHTTATGLDG